MTKHRQRSHSKYVELLLFGEMAQIDEAEGETKGGWGKGSKSQDILSHRESAFPGCAAINLDRLHESLCLTSVYIRVCNWLYILYFPDCLSIKWQLF